MNPDERVKQEKLLGKLQWLTERANIDFKGNPPPFEANKTQQSVERAKKLQSRALAGDTDFVPFWHSNTPLAYSVTRSNYLKDCDQTKFQYVRGDDVSAGHQKIDSETGLTEIQQALCWDARPNAPARTRPAPFTDTQGTIDNGQMYDCNRRGCGAKRLDPHTIEGLSASERTAAFREEILSHPKCTPEGTVAHKGRWETGTQLSSSIVKPLSKKRLDTAHSRRRNAVRLMERQTYY